MADKVTHVKEADGTIVTTTEREDGSKQIKIDPGDQSTVRYNTRQDGASKREKDGDTDDFPWHLVE